MQIAATGVSPYAPQLAARPAEAAERGPDRDNDGDEGNKVVAAAAIRPLSSSSGRGGKIDMMA